MKSRRDGVGDGVDDVLQAELETEHVLMHDTDRAAVIATGRLILISI